jgi:mannose-P-dolichol utilization defect protein 1
MAIVAPLASGMLSEGLWHIVGSLQIFLVILVKCPQIYTSWSNGSTGVLSVVTNFLNLAGVMARLFTTMTEVNNLIQIANYGVAILLNAIIFGQIIWYWNVKEKVR